VRNTDITKVDLNVVYIAMAIHVCCRYLFRVFHLLQTYDQARTPPMALYGDCFCHALFFDELSVVFDGPRKIYGLRN
jgi:hypothetical protein